MSSTNIIDKAIILLCQWLHLWYRLVRAMSSHVVGARRMARKSTDTAHLNLRYPEGLRRRLERAAKDGGRSMNTEIVERLEQSFRREDFEKLHDAVNLAF